MKEVLFLSIIAVLAVGGTLLFEWRRDLAQPEASTPPVEQRTVTPSPEQIVVAPPTNQPEQNVPDLCKRARHEVLADAIAQGVTNSLNDLKEIAAIYDLLCFGETDIEIAKEAPTPVDPGFGDQIKTNCNEEQIKYSACLTAYNTEMIQYQSCMLNQNKFGCLSSFEPRNNCPLQVSALCRRQVVGY